MKHLIFAMALALSACLGTTTTPEQQAVAFCNSFTGALQNMTTLKAAGALTGGEIATVDGVVAVVGPYCTSAAVSPPSGAVLAALDRLVVIQLAKRGN